MNGIDIWMVKGQVVRSTRGNRLRALVGVAALVVGLVWVLGEARSAADPAHPPVTQGVKWHPGHYYTLMSSGKNNPQYLTQVLSELKGTPALRGVQIRYEWPDLEPAEGRYDFTAIEQALADLATQDKRLIVFLQTKSFKPDLLPVPGYMKAERYEGGAFAFGTFGQHVPRGYKLKLWNAQVRDRLTALMNALGARFNSHPYFEGIGLPETSLGEPFSQISAPHIDQFYDNLLTVQRQMRVAFPNTMTFQFTNYPRPKLASFVGQLKSIGTALGGPDTFLDDPGLNFSNPPAPKGIYHYYPELSGLVPLTPSVMQSNYANTRHDGKGRVPTVSELFSFTRDRLKANYIFWTRAPGYVPQVLEMLNKLDVSRSPAGGLDSTCPKAYASCVE